MLQQPNRFGPADVETAEGSYDNRVIIWPMKNCMIPASRLSAATLFTAGLSSSAVLCLHFLLWLAPCSVVSAQETGTNRQQIEFFETRIRPVLIEHCYECHAASSTRLQGGLLVDSRDALLAGGDSGPALVPGQPDESLLLESLRYESYEMPPTGKLPDHIIADFEKWIREGAVDPRDSSANASARNSVDMETGRKFWSFQPITDPPIPQPRDNSWCATDIDRFILHRLEDRGLQPVADASAVDLVRRIFFDLTGLPPTPAQIEDFVNDSSTDAVQRLVDALLESPRFGERWGRHWLDVARYADSSGGGRLLMFHDAWRYRDYVINAFNSDKPIDHFIREQLAGDLLPFTDHHQHGEQLTATGFLMLGPHNFELQDKNLLRMEVVDEQIDVTGRAFLGMTLGCVRCHDHKFDPIPIEDYYALAGIFRSTDSLVHANVSRFVETELPLDPEQQMVLDMHQVKLQQIDQVIETRQTQIEVLRKELGVLEPVEVADLPGLVIDDEQATLTGNWNRSDNVSPYVGAGYQYANGDARAEFEVEVAGAGDYEVLVSWTPHPNRCHGVMVKATTGETQVESAIDQRQLPGTNGLFHSIGQLTVAAGQTVNVSVSGTKTGAIVIDAVQLIPQASDASTSVDRPHQLLTLLQQRLASLGEEELQREEHVAQAPDLPPKVMSVREHNEAGDYYVCIRGNADRLGDPVTRRALQVLPLDAELTILDGASGRLELANWMVDRGNPLTARVYVNRVWQHLLGHGLVRTPDNFGLMGEIPSHPLLLDHLARRFIENGWSTKWLIREITRSRVYQLSTQHREGNAAVDPENRLLWRAHRKRLDAEAIRDAMLCFNSQLDNTMGGPAMPADVKREAEVEYSQNRRTVYLPVFRNTLHDLLDVFDFPNPNLVSGLRNESTLPAQALYLMNSPFVLEQAELAARSLLAANVADDQERLDLAFRRALGRLPHDTERKSMAAFLAGFDHNDEAARLQAWTDICHTLMASLDFRYLN